MNKPTISYRDLKSMVAKDGIQKTKTHLLESINNGELSMKDFSLKQLFGALVTDGHGQSVGVEFLDEINDLKQRGQLFEDSFGSSNAINTATMAQVNGQLFYNEVLDAYATVPTELRNLIKEIPTTIKDGEKLGGISELSPALLTIPEGGTYPNLGVTQNYVQTPATYKVGGIVEVTLEELMADKTGQVMERVRGVGETVAIREELDAAACIADLLNVDGNQAHRYNWRTPPSQTPNVIATYGDSSGTHNWDNLSASTTLADFTQLNACETLLQNIVSPFTGLPYNFTGQRKLIVTQGNFINAKRLLNTVEVRDPNSTTRAQITEGNSLRATPDLIESKWLNYVMGNFSNSEPTTSYYYGYPEHAFRKMVFCPLQIEEATVLNPNNFLRDIVFSMKARKIYAYTTIEPRAMVKATA